MVLRLSNPSPSIVAAGGLVVVNADGSVSISPAAGKHTQVTSGRLGIGVAPSYALDILGNGTWVAHFANTAPNGNTILIEQPTDLGSVIDDCVNVVHRNTGDGIFFNHFGGRPSGFGGATGGKASLNVLIPQYLDYAAGSNGRTAGTANTKTEQIGLYVEVQPTAGSAAAVSIASWSNGNAIYVNNQSSAGGYASGNGNGMQIDSLGSGHPLFVAAKGSGTIQFELTGSGGVVVNDNASSCTGLFQVTARSASTVGFAMSVTADAGSRIQMRPDSIRFGTGTGTIDCNLFRSGTKAMKFGDSSGGNSRLEVPGGVATLVKTGTISDADFPSTPINGTLAVDITNNVLYVRVGTNTYKTIQLV